MSHQKIVSLDELMRKSVELKSIGKTVVLCHGTFDLIHAGHIRHLQCAKKQGDTLMVTITADEFVNKGPDRPIFNDQLRAESLAALECVDLVAINYAQTSENVINYVRPHVYVKGNEYGHSKNDITGNISLEKKAVEDKGGKIYFTDELTFSSSYLLNEHFGIFPQHTKSFLQDFQTRYQAADVIGMLKSTQDLKVLVFGDAIIDEYHYTRPLGQTGKGNMLAVQYDSKEQFAGGAMAVANHVAGMVPDTSLLTALGRHDSHEKFIQKKLKSNINSVFFYRDDGSTLVKRRFVDQDMAKLFEVYFYNDKPMPVVTENDICQWLNNHVAEYDAVIIPDFGNGLISSAMINILAAKAKFLAVNTQVNSGNRGYHVITHYPRVDFVSLNEPELRLATHNKHKPIGVLAREIAETVKASYVAVTLGSEGVLFVDIAADKEYKIPALSTQVVDRIGAGDAFLSIAGISAAKALPAEVCAFAGSVAAALDVKTVCNREAVDPIGMYKYMSTLLKWN